MKPSFTVPPRFAVNMLDDNRPIVKAIVDVSDPIGQLQSELTEMAQRGAVNIDDNTVQYIANHLLVAALSTTRVGSGSKQFAQFFHSDVREEVLAIVDRVNQCVQQEIVTAERHLEHEMGQRISPCEDVQSLSFRKGCVAVINYRLGQDPIDNVDDDPYSGMEASDKAFMEELDQEDAETIQDDNFHSLEESPIERLLWGNKSEAKPADEVYPNDLAFGWHGTIVGYGQ